MMQLRDKRQFQKKAKRFLPIFFLLVAVITAVIILCFSLKGKATSSDISYLSFNQSGEVVLTLNGEVKDTISLTEENDRKIEEGNVLIFEPEAVPFYLWSFDNGIYSYSNERKTLYKIEEGDISLDYKVVFSFSHLEIKDFKVDDDIFYFVPADNSSVFSYDGKTFTPIVTGKYIESFDVRNGNVSVAAGDTLYLIGHGFSKSVYLGDRTFDIFMQDTIICVVNNFGEEIGKALLHKFDYSLNSLGFIPIGNAGEIFFSGDKIVSGQNVYDLTGNKLYTFSVPLSEIKSHKNLFYGREGENIWMVDITGEKEDFIIESSNEIFLL